MKPLSRIGHGVGSALMLRRWEGLDLETPLWPALSDRHSLEDVVLDGQEAAS